MMDFLEKLLAQQGTRHPRQHDDHGGHALRPPRDVSESHATRHDSGDRSPLSGVLGALAQHKTLVGVAALLLLVVVVGGILDVVLLLPLVGTLVAGVGARDLSALPTDLPRLVSMLLVDVPKAVLDYLAPFLQLKTILEGKA